MPSKDAATVRIRLEAMGEEAGLWCDACMLPAVVAFDFMLMVNDSPDHVFQMRACMDCEWQRFQ